MKRIKFIVIATAIFTAAYLNHSSLKVSAAPATPEAEDPSTTRVEESQSTKGEHGEKSEEPAKSGKHGGGHGKEEAPAIDPSKFKFYPNVQSINDLDEPDEAFPENGGDEKTKIVYRTPDTCKEFSIYMQEKQRRLMRLEEQIRQKQLVLEQLKTEFETVTQKFSAVEGRIKKLMQRDPTNLKDNPELANMIKLYESFSAEEAAARLKNLDLDLTLALLKGMKPKKLSLIMSAMEPQLSAALSSQMVRGF